MEAATAAAAPPVAVMEVPEMAPPPTKKKKDKVAKGGAAGAAAAALAALEDLEVEASPGAAAAAPAALHEEPLHGGKTKGAAEAAPAAAVEVKNKLVVTEEAFADDFDDMPEKKNKNKKNKKKDEPKAKEMKKGKEEEEEAEDDFAAAVPTMGRSLGGEEEELTLEERKKRERGSARARVIDRDGKAGVARLEMRKVGVVYRNAEVLKDASWRVMTGDRVGIVGANGGGKTTMLRILAGEQEATTGEVLQSKAQMKIAYLKQEFSESLDVTRSLRAELQSVFVKEAAALDRLARVESRLDGGDTGPAALDELAEAQDAVAKLNAYQVGAKAEKIAIQMGFGDDDLEALVGSFSGGWKMRIGLAKVLLESPDVLLLDEPTNHLDLESVYWLEGFLRIQTNIALVVVSHDREFIDQVCTKIVDVDDGVTYSYEDCNYSKFLKRKRANRQAWEAAYKKQEAKVSEDKKFIQKNRAGARAAQAQSREKALEKLLASPDLVQRPPTEKRGLRFRFPEPPRCGLDILALEGVEKTYGSRTLFKDVSFELRNGDRVAVLGPNGVGKSTLLRLASAQEAPTAGGVAKGSANVVSAYYAQNQADALDLDKTVLRTVEDASLQGGAERSYETLRALLGQFLFKGDDVHKNVECLSGGEKARVALCTMMLASNNVLFLDEPTNHLDIPAKEMLEDALVNFDGTILVVSHDRYFISKVANTIFTLEGDGTMSRHDGDYASYMKQREDLLEMVERRYVDGVSKIGKAKERDPDVEAAPVKKKFGGALHGGSGRKDKGVKNAKRMA